MIKVSSLDIMDGKIPRHEDFWNDHVHFDIAATLMASVRAAPANCKAITFHEFVFIVKSYRPLIALCKELGIEMVMAKDQTFKRVRLDG
jgi:hypothetical protein